MRWQRRPRLACFFGPGMQSFLSALWQPAADVYRTKTGWIAKFDLAGVRPRDIQIVSRGHRLTVRGVRRDCQIEEGHLCHSMEIAYSEFERTIEFPVNLDDADITTDYQAGMLLVRIHTGEGRP